MKTQLIKTSTKDNILLHGLLYEPDRDSKGVILHIHGMAGSFYENAFLDIMSVRYTDAGYTFLSVNTRGHGHITDFALLGDGERYKTVGNTYERFEDCIFDIDAWMIWLNRQGSSNIILQGHSLGAPKAVYYLVQKRNAAVKKIILLSPADMVGLAEAEVYHKDLYQEAKDFIEVNNEDALLSKKLWGDYLLSAGTYVNFFTRGNAIDIFNTYFDQGSGPLSQVSVPVQIVFGEKDDAAIGSVSEVIKKIEGKMLNCHDLHSVIIPGASHSYYREEKVLMDEILYWLDIDRRRS